jgi:hypothetical protein
LRVAPDFYPFHPKTLRLGMLACAVCALALAAWIAASLRGHFGLLGAARLGLSLGLLAAFLVPYFRLRPRPGWGVELGERELKIARPLGQEAMEIPWENVSHVSRIGRRKQQLMVVLGPEPGRILLARHLFANGREFDDLSKALTARKPPPRLDA